MTSCCYRGIEGTADCTEWFDGSAVAFFFPKKKIAQDETELYISTQQYCKKKRERESFCNLYNCNGSYRNSWRNINVEWKGHIEKPQIFSLQYD